MKKIIAIDIETNGLYPSNQGSKIFCVAINYGNTIKVHTNIEECRKVLEDESILKIIHNAAFDNFWLKQLHGINVKNIWDTFLCEKILVGESLPKNNVDEHLKIEMSASLLYTLKRYGLADLKNKNIGVEFSKKNNNEKLTTSEIEYAKNDVRYLINLQLLQERRLINLNLMAIANLENSLVERVVKMKSTGIKCSEKIWLEIAKSNELKYNNLLKRMPADVENWNSPAQVKKFFVSRGVPVNSLTDAERIVRTYPDPVLKQFIELRKNVKNNTTYGSSWLVGKHKNTIDRDGRIRADFEQIVDTGRLACSNPNLQQIPRNGDFRKAFIPENGNVFVIGDFSNQEIGIMAAASGEDLWINAMLRGEDVHSLTASLLFQNTWTSTGEKNCSFPKKCTCKKHNSYRSTAKTINFAIAYGAGISNLSNQLNINENEAKTLLHRYKRVVPKLIRWLEKNANSAIKTRTSFSADPFKRRRVLHAPEKWMLANIGKNNPVQSCGANMIKLAIISLPELFPVVLTIHDEIILEVKKTEAKKFAKDLKIIMEKAADYCTGIKGLIKTEPVILNNLNKQ